MRATIICFALVASACTDGNKCGPGTRAIGNACLPDTSCPEGYLSVNGNCIAIVSGCALGSSMHNGACVPDITDCGAGTHIEGGVCVPDGLPDADVFESLDANLPAEVVLPENGSISLGGRVDTPVDVDGDSYADPDYDDFVFHADAGTWLRIRASSDDAALPAFMIISASTDEQGWPLFTRYAVEPNADVTSREVYLPRSDDYILWVTDYAHLWPTIFGWPTVPVGGDAFTYRVVIENLGTPTATAVSSAPWSDDGDLADGSLRFYNLEENTNIAVLARSVSVPGTEIYPLLTAFDADGTPIAETPTSALGYDVDLLLPGGRGHLLVQDHFLVVGPQRDFAVDISPITPVDCGTGACNAELSDDHIMLSWDLSVGDFLTVGVSHDSSNRMDFALFDSSLQPVLPRQRVSSYPPGKAVLFAEQQRSVYLWLQKDKGADIDLFTVDQKVVATPLLTTEATSSCEVNELPDTVMADSGVAHLTGLAGQLILFNPLSPHGNSWVDPTESLLSTGLEPLGPATDALSADFAPLAPLMAVLPTDGTYLHLVQDVDGDIAGSSYDTLFVAATPAPMISAGVDAPTSVNGTLEAGVAVLSHTGALWQRTAIEVVTDGFRPEVRVLNRGTVTSLYPETYWLTDDTAPQLGLVARGIGSANSVTVDHVSFATEDLIVITDADGGVTGTFDVTVQVFVSPTNDTCAGATALGLSTGTATVQASSAGASDQLDLDWSNPCTSRPSQGPELFYAIDANAGDSFEISVTADHAAVIYLLDACGGTCLAGASGATQSFTWQAETSGQVIVAVDGYAPRSLGLFTLEVQRQ